MIVRRKPQEASELKEADLAWFESDAGNNISAIKEIDAEAAQYGLVRTPEYWLQTVSFNDQVVRRGFCYRPEPSPAARIISERRSLEPQSVSAVDTIRQFREE